MTHPPARPHLPRDSHAPKRLCAPRACRTAWSSSRYRLVLRPRAPSAAERGVNRSRCRALSEGKRAWMSEKRATVRAGPSCGRIKLRGSSSRRGRGRAWKGEKRRGNEETSDAKGQPRTSLPGLNGPGSEWTADEKIPGGTHNAQKRRVEPEAMKVNRGAEASVALAGTSTTYRADANEVYLHENCIHEKQPPACPARAQP